MGYGLDFISKLYLVDALTVFSELTGNFDVAERTDYMVDFLGSVRGYTAGGANSSVVEPTTYKPFGAALTEENTLRYGWTGNTGSSQTDISCSE